MPNPMKQFMKGINKAAKKVEAAAIGVGQGVSQVTQRLNRELGHREESVIDSGPPQMMSAPTFSNEREPVAPTQSEDRASTAVAAAAPRAAEVDLSPAAAGVPPPPFQWWGPEASGCDYLCICIREARGLPIVDYDTRSTTSHVRITLSPPGSEPAQPSALNPSRYSRPPERESALEVQTRNVYRTRNPMWEQRFFFPMDALSEDTKLTVAVYGGTAHMNIIENAITHHFSGQIVSSLGHMLSHMHGPMQPFSRCYQLARRRVNDRVSGQLCMAMVVLPKEVYHMVQNTEKASTLLDHQILQTLLHSYTLNVHLHAVRNFRTPVNGVGDQIKMYKLEIQVRLGRAIVTLPVSTDALQSALEGNVRVHALNLEQLMAVPLDKCFSRAPKGRKEKDEIGDVKIYLMAGKEVLAKTQVPIWDMPVVVEADWMHSAQEEEEQQQLLQQLPQQPQQPQQPAESEKAEEGKEAEKGGKKEPKVGANDGDGVDDGDKAGGQELSDTVWQRKAFNSLVKSMSLHTSAAGVDQAALAAAAEAAVAMADKEAVSPSARGAAAAVAAAGGDVAAGGSTAVASAAAVVAAGSRPGSDDRGMTGVDAYMAGMARRAKAASTAESEGTSLGDEPVHVPIVTGLALLSAFMRRNPARLGYRYKRVMESYSDGLVGGPELEMSLSLVPCKDDPANGACKAPVEPEAQQATEVDDETGDVDAELPGETVPPITVPPPLAVLVGSVSLMGRPTRVFDLLFKEDSPYRAKRAAKEELRDVVHGPWSHDAALAASSGYKGAKTRTVTYVRPLSIPIPMAPKQCNVTEVHSLLVNAPGGFVVESKVTTSAPKGDTFYVLIQWCGSVEENNRTRIRASFKVEFVKSVGLLKGAVEGGAVSNTKELVKQWMDDLVLEMASGPIAGLRTPSVTLLEREAAGLAATAATAAGPAERTTSGGTAAVEKSLHPVVWWLLVGMLAMALWVLLGAVWRLAASMGELARALQAAQARRQEGGAGLSGWEGQPGGGGGEGHGDEEARRAMEVVARAARLAVELLQAAAAEGGKL